LHFDQIEQHHDDHHRAQRGRRGFGRRNGDHDGRKEEEEVLWLLPLPCLPLPEENTPLLLDLSMSGPLYISSSVSKKRQHDTEKKETTVLPAQRRATEEGAASRQLL